MATATVLACIACTVQSVLRATNESAKQVGIVLSGDAGYHLRYAANDRNDPRTVEEFVARQLKVLTAAGAAGGESLVPPHYTFPDSGHTIFATGMHAVASAISEYCSSGHPCDFGLLLGDNIYPSGATEGKDGYSDAQRFEDVFVEPYELLFSRQPDFQFNVVLGNHDWSTSVGGANAQRSFLESHQNYFMDGLYYRRRYEADVGSIDVFGIDTQMLLSNVVVPRSKLDADGNPEAYAEIAVGYPWVREYAFTQGDQLRWLEGELKRSNAAWKIVFGHHPLWSSSGGKFQQAQALRRMLLPMLCRYADLYVAGHEHTLEVHEQSCDGYGGSIEPLTHIVSGAASKQRPVNHIFARRQAESMPGFRPVWAKGMLWGFAHLELRPESATVTFISTPDDQSGEPVMEFVHDFVRRTARH